MLPEGGSRLITKGISLAGVLMFKSVIPSVFPFIFGSNPLGMARLVELLWETGLGDIFRSDVNMENPSVFLEPCFLKWVVLHLGGTENMGFLAVALREIGECYWFAC